MVEQVNIFKTKITIEIKMKYEGWKQLNVFQNTIVG